MNMYSKSKTIVLKSGTCNIAQPQLRHVMSLVFILFTVAICLVLILVWHSVRARINYLYVVTLFYMKRYISWLSIFQKGFCSVDDIESGTYMFKWTQSQKSKIITKESLPAHQNPKSVKKR